MRARIRLLVAVARPSVVTLVTLFTATGVAQGGGGDDPWRLGLALTSVLASLVAAVATNDLADVAIDRVNLADDPARLLVGAADHRRHLAVGAVVGAALALGAAALLSWLAAALVAVGLVLSAAYSLGPTRLADRGVLAPLLLPLGYVAVPVVVGIQSARPTLTVADLALVAALYVGFTGRIVLKDFRDVRGDSLFGKRTFLVRHGRRATCWLSAASWVAGLAVLPAVRGATLVLASALLVVTVVALVLLRALAVDGGPRRDEALVGGLALAGRGAVVTLVAHLSMLEADVGPAQTSLVVAALVAVTLGQVASMVAHGPRSGLSSAALGELDGAPARPTEPAAAG